MLLHLIDISPMAEDPIESANTIVKELAAHDTELALKERWLVLNKIDTIPDDERQARCEEVIQGLGWTGPVFIVSGVSGEGCDEVCQSIAAYYSDPDREL